jgi:hypothetical protein
VHSIYGKSETVSDWRPVTVVMQYDGGVQSAHELRTLYATWTTIVRCHMSNPELKVFFSTKLDKKSFNNVINVGSNVSLGRW